MDGLDQQTILDVNKSGWNDVAHQFYGGTALPEYGPLAPAEDQVQLLGNPTGLRVLELGCGSGHSLLYLAQQGAAELWGLDLAPAQVAFATTLLHDHQVPAHLFTSPMEINPGIPESYFDLVVSIYALGWTVHLDQTLARVAAYLKPNGRLIFSWQHPLYGCVDHEAEHFIVRRSYHAEGPYLEEAWRGVPIVQYPRKLSTFVNGLINAGFIVERLIETDLDAQRAKPQASDPDTWYSLAHATLIPTTFIIAARKPAAP
ncbi:MAG: methyltransferase domain-containing protein [Chloroflexota bacterium]|nr:methyltransferase domain-containing protein [Chloroflexota bacterium]